MESNWRDLRDTQNRLSTMKYSELRQAAKRHSVNANQKKDVLIMELSKVWNLLESNKENITSKKVAAAEIPLSCSSKSALNETLNQTFTVDRDTHNDFESYAEILIAAKNDPAEKENILLHNQELNPVSVDASSFSRKVGQDTKTPSKGRCAAGGAIVARFAALHQELAEKQPTLQEIDANVKRKFAEHEKSVPDIFKRLATPKVSKGIKSGAGAGKNIGYKFRNVDKDPSKMNFSFSKLYATENVFAAVQKNVDVSSRSRIPLPTGRIGLELDVKKLTKRLNTKQVRRSPRFTKLTNCVDSGTVPLVSTRLQKLTTPKDKIPNVSLVGSKNEEPRSCRRRYTPYHRLIPYVDTTRMTDSQFYEAKMLGQIQTLTAISASRTETRQQLRRKHNEARERILRSKRGC